MSKRFGSGDRVGHGVVFQIYWNMFIDLSYVRKCLRLLNILHLSKNVKYLTKYFFNIP